MEKIDELDRKILKIITTSARIPFKEVAEQCGVSRAAVHQRVQKMFDNGVITGSSYHVQPKQYTLGAFGILIKVFAHDNEHLLSLLTTKIQAIPGVSDTTTLTALAQPIYRQIPVEI